MDIMSSINTFVAILFQPILGVPLIILIGIVVFITWYLVKPKPKEELKHISLFKEVRKDMKELFSVAEEKLGYGKTLSIGIQKIGYILKMINFNWRNVKGNPIKELKLKALEKEKPQTSSKQFYGFKVCQKGFVNKALANILGIGIKYYLIDKELCTINPFDVVINPLSQYTNYLGIMIFSNVGEQIISNVAYKKTLENTLEAMVNYIPKMSFIELQQSKFAGRLDKLTKLEKQKYKDRLENLIQE